MKGVKSDYAVLINRSLKNYLFIEYCYVLDYDKKIFMLVIIISLDVIV